MDFFRFPLFAPHTNPHFWTDRTTHDVTSASTFCHLLRLPPPFQRHIFLSEWLHRLASAHSHVRVCVANTRVYMRPSSGRLSTVSSPLPARVCVFTAAWLHIPDIFFFAILMGPSVTATRFVVCAHSRVCVRVSLNPHVVPDISIFAIATHSFSHICTLSNTHFCLCLHCHYYEVPFPYIRK